MVTALTQRDSAMDVAVDAATTFGATSLGRSDYDDNVRVEGFAVSTDAMPAQTDLTFASANGRVDADYTASSTIGSLKGAFSNRRGQPLQVALEVADLPTSLMFDMNPADSSLTLNAGAPIGHLTVDTSLNDGPVPSRPTGDAIAVRTDGPAVGASVALTGVRTLQAARQRGPGRPHRTLLSRSQPLTAALIDVGSLLGVGRVSAVPANFDIAALTDPASPQATYSASSAIPQTDVYVSDFADGHTTFGRVLDLDADIAAGQYDEVVTYVLRDEPGTLWRIDPGPFCVESTFQPHAIARVAGEAQASIPGDGTRHIVWPNPALNGDEQFPEFAGRIVAGRLLSPYRRDAGFDFSVNC